MKKPVIIAIRTGLMWAAAFHRSKGYTYIHTPGPVLAAETSREDLRHNLAHWELHGVSMEQRTHSPTELFDITHTMFEDFIFRLLFCAQIQKIYELRADRLY